MVRIMCLKFKITLESQIHNLSFHPHIKKNTTKNIHHQPVDVEALPFFVLPPKMRCESVCSRHTCSGKVKKLHKKIRIKNKKRKKKRYQKQTHILWLSALRVCVWQLRHC